MIKQQNVAQALGKEIFNVPIRFLFHRNRHGAVVWRKGNRSGRIHCVKTRPAKHILIDPWEVRNKFLTLHQDEDSLLAFLNSTGIWYEAKEKYRIQEFWDWKQILAEMLLGTDGYQEMVQLDRVEILNPAGQLPQLLQPQFSAVKMTLRKSRVLTWEDVLLGLYKIKFDFPKIDARALGNDPPFIVAETDTTLSAMLGSVHLDRIRRARFKRCARKDCPIKLFELTSQHKREYCSQACAHIESVRRIRARIHGPARLCS